MVISYNSLLWFPFPTIKPPLPQQAQPAPSTTTTVRRLGARTILSIDSPASDYDLRSADFGCVVAVGTQVRYRAVTRRVRFLFHDNWTYMLLGVCFNRSRAESYCKNPMPVVVQHCAVQYNKSSKRFPTVDVGRFIHIILSDRVCELITVKSRAPFSFSPV